jgi:hypothetical protein
METVSLVASAVSVALAIFAIWLSMHFQRQANESATRIDDAARSIGATVERLENLFNRLYTDTFGMMKDTVADMRKHAWRDEPPVSVETLTEAVGNAQEKVEAVKRDVEDKIAGLIGRLTAHPGEREAGVPRREIDGMLDEVIRESRAADIGVRRTAVRQAILNYLRLMKRDRNNVPVIGEVLNAVRHPESLVLEELERLAIDGVIYIDRQMGPMGGVYLQQGATGRRLRHV